MISVVYIYIYILFFANLRQHELNVNKRYFCCFCFVLKGQSLEGRNQGSFDSQRSLLAIVNTKHAHQHQLGRVRLNKELNQRCTALIVAPDRLCCGNTIKRCHHSERGSESVFFFNHPLAKQSKFAFLVFFSIGL